MVSLEGKGGGKEPGRGEQWGAGEAGKIVGILFFSMFSLAQLMEVLSGEQG